VALVAVLRAKAEEAKQEEELLLMGVLHRGVTAHLPEVLLTALRILPLMAEPRLDP
jgi:hypothetical protein